mmetsp:Transcript_50784/g.115353  ORF Transcript_50784/g.115353 Transcript_50784/m.115353 type:complete len:379 (-) Transcript_50784:13-1149(-)
MHTKYSGLRPADCGCPDRALPLAQVLERLREACKGKVLVGHGIDSDFKALRWSRREAELTCVARVLDTELLDWGPDRPRKLASLAEDVLGLVIQTGEHDPVEDARATLALALAHERKFKGAAPPLKRVSVTVLSERPEPDAELNSTHSMGSTHSMNGPLDGGLATERGIPAGLLLSAAGPGGKSPSKTVGGLSADGLSADKSADGLASGVASGEASGAEGAACAPPACAPLFACAPRKVESLAWCPRAVSELLRARLVPDVDWARGHTTRALFFPPTISKAARALVHESASKLRLHARSRGLGADRFVAVCRREDAPPDDTSEDLDWLSGARLGNEGACEGRGASGLDPHEGEGRPVTSPRGPAGPAGPAGIASPAGW